eukprot:6109400-Pyramimonas_sp.AAC.1
MVRAGSVPSKSRKVVRQSPGQGRSSARACRRRVARSAVGARPWNAVPYFVGAIAPCCTSLAFVVACSLVSL